MGAGWLMACLWLGLYSFRGGGLECDLNLGSLDLAAVSKKPTDSAYIGCFGSVRFGPVRSGPVLVPVRSRSRSRSWSGPVPVRSGPVRSGRTSPVRSGGLGRVSNGKTKASYVAGSFCHFLPQKNCCLHIVYWFLVGSGWWLVVGLVGGWVVGWSGWLVGWLVGGKEKKKKPRLLPYRSDI